MESLIRPEGDRHASMLCPGMVLAAVIGWGGDQSPSFEGLGQLVPGGPGSSARGISADGTTVVGNAGGPHGEEIFVWTCASGMRRLSEPPVGPGDGQQEDGWTGLSVEAVSPDGSTLVGTGTSGEGRTEALRWSGRDGLVGLGVVAGQDASNARGVSGDGRVVVGVGTATLAQHGSVPQGGQWRRVALRWEDGAGPVGLGTLPGRSNSGAEDVSYDGTVVVGWSNSEDGRSEAFRWTADGGMQALGFLPGGDVSIALAVSAGGDVVAGWGNRRGGRTEAFLWTEAQGMRGLGCPAGLDIGDIEDISADGAIVVGWGRGTDCEEVALIWTEAEGPRRLADELALLGLRQAIDGWKLAAATGVSGDGRIIVGHGINPAGISEAFLVDLGGRIP